MSALKSRKQVYCEKRINQLRGELHKLIEREKLDNSRVQEISRELDELIMLYYKEGNGFRSKVC